MEQSKSVALAATNAIRQTRSFRQLSVAKQRELNRNLSKIESSLGADPYSMVMETPLDFQSQLGGSDTQNRNSQQQPPPSPDNGQSAAIRQFATQGIGQRSADALEAVDFPGFVASLVNGTFQAIVDATVQQLHEYAGLIAKLSRSVDEFAQENVSDGQVRQRLLERHGSDLYEIIPSPGEEGTPRVVPRPEKEGESPQWLKDYGLEGESLSEELTEGPLLNSVRRIAAEERMKTLSTMVLMGINRIVVNKGHIRAKMQFHAVARDRTEAEIVNMGVVQQGSVANRDTGQSMVAARVSTVKANVQADAGIKSDLMGEVNIEFATETFPLERFADPNLMSIITRHARWQSSETKTKTENDQSVNQET